MSLLLLFRPRDAPSGRIQRRVIQPAKRRPTRKSDDDEALKAINCEILAKLGNAALARCGQALISAKTVRRKEYLAKATSYRALRVKMETDHAQ